MATPLTGVALQMVVVAPVLVPVLVAEKMTVPALGPAALGPATLAVSCTGFPGSGLGTLAPRVPVTGAWSSVYIVGPDPGSVPLPPLQLAVTV